MLWKQHGQSLDLPWTNWDSSPESTTYHLRVFSGTQFLHLYNGHKQQQSCLPPWELLG